MKRRVIEAAAGAAGVAVAGAAVRAAQQRRAIKHRNAGDTIPFSQISWTMSGNGDTPCAKPPWQPDLFRANKALADVVD